jgi:hypothetical protein
MMEVRLRAVKAHSGAVEDPPVQDRTERMKQIAQEIHAKWQNEDRTANNDRSNFDRKNIFVLQQRAKALYYEHSSAIRPEFICTVLKDRTARTEHSGQDILDRMFFLETTRTL